MKGAEIMIKQKFSYFLIALYLLSTCFVGCSEYNYQPGRDTVDIYGDGTFQVMRRVDEKGLCYCPTGYCVIPDITQYWNVGVEVYFVGKWYDQSNAYGIVNQKTNTLRLCWEVSYKKYIPEEAIESGDIVLLPDFASFTQKEQATFMEREGKELSQCFSHIPVIESFSSTAYQYDSYGFGQIRSVRFLYDGKSENLSVDDPRVVRLLNAIDYSAMRGHTEIRLDSINEHEFKSCLEADTYLLDIEFESPDLPDALKSRRSVCRLIVSANRILVVDEFNDTELHSPFQHILKDPDSQFSDSAWQDIAEAALWGDREYLDLLLYADFVTYDILLGTVSANP